MNKQELEQKLWKCNIPKDMYDLEGGFPNEAFCLNRYGSLWEVYYSERGIKTGLKQFSNEEQACEYLYKIIINEVGCDRI